jgi:ectoine hydroxylase-related dioxygenase (phytanoyl-CoA dioxygenase family)
MLASKCRGTLRVPVWPPLQQGDAVCFDYRILHRGRANTTDQNRLVLVLTFCEPWFTDVLNFPKRSMKKPAAGGTAS